MKQKDIIKQDSMYLWNTLNVFAQSIYGEFGYSTCTEKEQQDICKLIVEEGLILFPNEK